MSCGGGNRLGVALGAALCVARALCCPRGGGGGGGGLECMHADLCAAGPHPCFSHASRCS